MNIEVYGVTMEVKVSEGGVFHLVKSPRINARTLKGLEKKALDVFKPQGNMPIEHVNTGAKGIVINVIGSTWNRKYTVKWSDGTQTLQDYDDLQRITTAEEKKKLAQMEKAAEDAQKVYDAADEALTDYKLELSVHDELLKNFGKS